MKKTSILLIAIAFIALSRTAMFAVTDQVSLEGIVNSQDYTFMNTAEVQSALSIGTTEVSPNTALEVNGNVKVGAAGAYIEGATGKLYGDGSSLTNLPGSSIGVALDGGGGSPIASDTLSYVYVPYSCTIHSWTMLADVAGSIVIDVWKADYAHFPPTNANSITNGHKPALSSSMNAQATDLSGWSTVEVNAGDVIAFHVDSASLVSRVTFVMGVTKN
jgi:hypothetical protein